ncbi:hypothetical protein CDD83_3756 [Cordyceps sp. RAO-2017]|nr:hypothetical protein CDD83_3756 [Cordyceps sp. RAO-2017]
MRAEGWLHGRLARYAYLPPAVVGQLLWNLRHALFADSASQATTASAAASSPSGSEPAFLDHGASRASSVDIGSAPAPPPASQLLTRSQMLPESVLCDLAAVAAPGPEIGDSDSDGEPL